MATDASLMKYINLSGLAVEELFPEYIVSQSFLCPASINTTWELIRNVEY